jgi:phenylalanyl-tRNA synthetase beta chain
LGFGIQNGSDGKFVAIVPRFRHDIKNIQDITEEIVRIVGINNIESKPLAFVEKNRHNMALQRHNFKKALRGKLSAVGFNETISYIFADSVKQKEYGFDSVSGILDLANPIAEDLNTPRTTLLVNLLEAVKRNVSYTERSIGLFEEHEGEHGVEWSR